MTYLLLIYLSENRRIKVGRLGLIDFFAGFYVYVGSAKFGVDRRVKRHLSREKKLFWHIDYLLSVDGCDVINVFSTDAEIEHRVVKNFLDAGFRVVRGFGSSDCDCLGHLFYVEDMKKFEDVVSRDFVVFL
ncbi:Uri superfamily endonuclease [Candidatus Thermokryptus mobilis]|uniref:Uri superfamily endonuclease n=1 Tax=Candidatus Thermokryptus mobilis TaxID=1643428 RepID=A0A0S4NEG5_9BACT|nr:GIY-YIG nuclease family protein [Candidatus Thermokryptus mobilis]CUU08413.1 Uri superfamily endonuclease [Candidatus Thermokryptus mobilis]